MKRVISETKVPVKIWATELEPDAEKQLRNVASMPFVQNHVAVMPDAHHGMGSTVGTVIATKGAIIPGSMGAKSFIVKGLGNPQSFNSCSHGAGRKMSRTAARKLFTLEDLNKQTEGVECRKDSEVIDEIPGAYKDIDEVMANQIELVEPVYQLKQILCIKG